VLGRVEKLKALGAKTTKNLNATATFDHQDFDEAQFEALENKKD